MKSSSQGLMFVNVISCSFFSLTCSKLEVSNQSSTYQELVSLSLARLQETRTQPSIGLRGKPNNTSDSKDEPKLCKINSSLFKEPSQWIEAEHRMSAISKSIRRSNIERTCLASPEGVVSNLLSTLTGTMTGGNGDASVCETLNEKDLTNSTNLCSRYFTNKELISTAEPKFLGIKKPGHLSR